MSNVLRLFLIEDQEEDALLVRKHLERAGHQVTCCRTAADALIVLGHSHFDLVLLDYLLPDMSGKDLLQALKREGINTPVLMVTGEGNENLAAELLRAGWVIDYMAKDRQLKYLGELPKRVSESEKRYRLQNMNHLLIAALESARDGILITDLQGVILHVNKAVEGLTGFTREELLQQVLWEPRSTEQGEGPRHPREGPPEPARAGGGVRNADARSELCAPRAALEGVLARHGWQGEWTVCRKDHSLVDVSLTVSPIVDPLGQLTHTVAIMRDVTDRKNLERQLLQAQKMQSVGTLAGGVAHEFNNLLAGINGYASLGLREPGVEGTLREFLQHVVDLSERAAVLTRQLLTFARKPALLRRPTPLSELLRSTAELVHRTLHIDVRVDVEATPTGAWVVEADANQLQQALVNLALNARDAMRDRDQQEGYVGPSRGRLTFRLRQELLSGAVQAFPQNVPPGAYVVIEVTDDGCGMSDKVLTQALDPFFTTKEVGQGTGLGLPMVFGIVQGHQGHLTIDSAPGRGTSVKLYLPRAPLAPVKSREPFEAGQVLEPETVPGRSILVVDDEEAVQDVIRRFLEIAGHHVSCVSNGEAALEALSNGRPCDLVILDLMMPREESATTFQRLRQRRPGLPILLCTGLPQADPAPHLLQAGAVGLLRKPFRMNELWYAVNAALSRPDDD
jgi:two-component system, cell cycle sensor histidine kinase and response regulator CckA